jgi:hypothetical protein
MAELGIIASGMGIVSLAIQIGDSVLRLKNFLESVKEAPEEIRYLIEEIQTLGLVLSELAADSALVTIPSVGKCMELCSRSAEILAGIAKELDKDIGKKRRTGGIKVVLKKGEIEKLREQLKSAQFMLMLSNQTYLG